MADATGAGRTKIELAGILFGIGDELGERLRGDRRMNNDDDRQIGDNREHAQFTVGIVGELLVEHRIHHDDRARREKQGVTVRLAMGDGFGADRALRAGLVLDEHRLLQVAREIFGDQPGLHVGWAARGVGHNDLDRPRRIVGRTGDANCAPRKRQVPDSRSGPLLRACASPG